jgi:very-short-patch-repair endonuclease
MEKNIFNLKSQKTRRQSLRNEMPNSEIIIWSRLKNRQIRDCKFRRQYGVGNYVVDFYCPRFKLAIEIDGDSHFDSDGSEKYDVCRQKFIEDQGIIFLRFTNTDIYKKIDIVLDKIDETVCMLEIKKTTLASPPLLEKEGKQTRERSSFLR